MVPVRDELEEYLLSPLETDMDLDLLKYWKLKETTWPKLAKMAKQYLAAPFSSGGDRCRARLLGCRKDAR